MPEYSHHRLVQKKGQQPVIVPYHDVVRRQFEIQIVIDHNEIRHSR